VSKERLLVERAWKSEVFQSVERFRLLEFDDSHALSGRAEILFKGDSVDLTYRVDTRPDWSTSQAEVLIPEAGIAIEVAADGSGSWMINGQQRNDLDWCIDIDLGWTPATNTLPIRRTQATFNRGITVKAAWLQWPELAFTPVHQTYKKISDNRWRYEQGEFSAELVTDPHGVVVTYGRDPAIWYST
jgi:uncharacterized protein